MDGSLEKRCLGDKVLHNITKRIKFNKTHIIFNKFSNKKNIDSYLRDN